MKQHLLILFISTITTASFSQEYVQTTTNNNYANKNFTTTGNFSLGSLDTQSLGGAKLNIKVDWKNWISLIDNFNKDLYGFHNPNGGGRMELYIHNLETNAKQFGVFTVKSNGNIGIGNSSPQAKLEVKRSGTLGGVWNPSNSFLTLSDTGNSSLILDTNEIYSSSTLHIGSKSSEIVRFRTISETGASDKMVIEANGNVGIGAMDPEEKLHVKGTTTIDGDIGTITEGSHWQTGRHTLELQNRDAGDVVLSFHRAGHTNAAIKHPVTGGIIFSATGGFDQNHMLIKTNGNVGIGTNSPDSKLTVKGKIHAEEVKIDLSVPAPDYVFLKDYKLKTIEEVETYIKQEGHLPNIPSAKVMESEGVKLGSLNMKLLEKIEELTLYTIAQEKQLKTQEKRIKEQEVINNKLASKNKDLENRLKRIENLLDRK